MFVRFLFFFLSFILILFLIATAAPAVHRDDNAHYYLFVAAPSLVLLRVTPSAHGYAMMGGFFFFFPINLKIINKMGGKKNSSTRAILNSFSKLHRRSQRAGRPSAACGRHLHGGLGGCAVRDRRRRRRPSIVTAQCAVSRG